MQTKTYISPSISSTFQTHSCCCCTFRMLCHIIPVMCSWHISPAQRSKKRFLHSFHPTLQEHHLDHPFIYMKIPFEHIPREDLQNKTIPILNLTTYNLEYSPECFTHLSYSQQCTVADIFSHPWQHLPFLSFSALSSMHLLHRAHLAHHAPRYQVTLSVILFSLCFLRVELHSYFCIPVLSSASHTIWTW